ncbi:phosphotransferase family protein [Haloarcula salinisoli]|uniref:Phosphotransferase n=1 Tax=Haloarcula salinisoli TaxID=2487746 RepID=A0A8J8CAD7_9EURY|nr:phosphotransferase [Halomicroarcula salinisoli]MBX0305174.1 phosphotransferase [Halomicroarcula salinisoli]
MNESLATGIVGQHYSRRTVVGVEPVAAGHRPTAVVRFADRSPLVVQLSATIEAVRTEATLVSAVRDRTDVPVAAVLSTGSHDGRAYAISEFRPGTDLHTTFADSPPTVRGDIAGQFGRYLGELHTAFAFEGCGELTRASGPAGAEHLVATGDTSDTWLVEYGRRAVERLPVAFDPLRDRLRDCLDAATVDRVTPRLFPWDLRPGNALVADGTVSAVLDWERPMAAPPALALAKAEYLVADWYVDDPAPLRAAFRAGYERVRSLPTVRPVHRVVAIADSAVDSRGGVTNPGYPERERAASVDFHRAALSSALSG